ncbi:DNA-binding response OmpR family regulator [Planotetraspora sp. GP83]
MSPRYDGWGTDPNTDVQNPTVNPGSGASLAAVSELMGRVLVVDDDEVIRQLIAVNLTLEGFEVETAFDGQDCLDRVHDVDPDVITLDVMMPRLDGWETATRLRTDQSTSHIKVVLITARAQEDDRRRGLGIGVDAYLTKPFDPAELIEVVRDLAKGTAPAS